MLVESDRSMSSDVRNRAGLRHMREYHLSTRSRMKRAHEYYNTPDYQIPSISDSDSDYKYVVNLFNTSIHAETLILSHDVLMQFVDQKQPAWETQLKNATTVKDIILIIKLFGQSSIANRLDYLHSLPVDEPYQKPINLESVRRFVLFIMSRAYLPYPDITVNADGRVTVEWDVAGRGMLILEFLSSEYVEYLEVFRQSKLAQRKYNTGVASIGDITDTIKLWPYIR